MTASFRVRALSGVAASLTVTALIAASISVPAQAAPQPFPVSPSAKIKLPGGVAASRVIAGRYLVETVAAPVAAGGNKFSTKASNTTASSAVKAAGAKVGGSYSELWSGVGVTATDAQIKAIAQSPSVKAIYPVLRVAMPKATRSATKPSSALNQISALGLAQDGSGVKVGVIDTGIDYNNPDLGGSGTEDNNADFGIASHRVKYGWDFVGDLYDPDADEPGHEVNPDPYPDDCAGHGTHVAGIIGADGSGGGANAAIGVAPNVTFGAYRVFGCDGSTDTEIIIAALNQAKLDGMNVVNLSLGSDFDSWPSYPENVAVANLAKSGTVVVIAAGNAGDAGLFAIGSPAVGTGVISVAAYEPATIRTRAVSINGVSYPYTPVDSTGTAPISGSTTLKVATPAAAVTACTASGALDPVVGPGVTLLVKRGGGCTYHEKVINAQNAGAAAVVISNDTPGIGSFTAHSDKQGETVDPTIPAISIGGTDGTNIAATLAAGTLPMTWLDYQVGLPNPAGGELADFSSAGLAADLSLVPTITAPGANIYSTLPLEQDGHGNMSGTSMASPYIAGAAALVIQGRALAGHSATVAQLLYNTAVPVAKSGEVAVATHPEAVFRQGSGVVNVAGAMGAGVLASPSTIKLGEGKSHTLKISLTNHTAGVLTYTASRLSGVSAAASTSGGNDVGTTTPLYGFADVGFKAYSKAVTIKPGKTAKVKVKITAPSAVLAGKAGMLYGGWVQFRTTGLGNTVSVPFAGMRGDYQKVKLLNSFRYVDEGNMPWQLPTLGYLGAQGLGPDYLGQHVYTMDQDAYDVAFVLFHLDYPASDATLKVTNTRTHKSYDAVINWDFYNPNTGKASKSSLHLGKLPRDAALQYVAMEDAYLSKGRVWRLPNGTYRMTLKVLKPLGKASKKSQWESFTTHSFIVNYTG